MPISSSSVIETEDNLGSTEAFSGTANTTPADVPGSPDKVISQALIAADDRDLQVSFDGGTTYFTFNKSEILTWDVKGKITSLKVKTPTGTAAYRIILNFEDV